MLDIRRHVLGNARRRHVAEPDLVLVVVLPVVVVDHEAVDFLAVGVLLTRSVRVENAEVGGGHGLYTLRASRSCARIASSNTRIARKRRSCLEFRRLASSCGMRATSNSCARASWYRRATLMTLLYGQVI